MLTDRRKLGIRVLVALVFVLALLIVNNAHGQAGGVVYGPPWPPTDPIIARWWFGPVVAFGLVALLFLV